MPMSTCWPLPLTARLDQGGEDANGAVESAGNVADGGAGPDGRTAGLAGDAHDAAHALDDDVEGGQAGVGARLSKAGDRAVDEPGRPAHQVFGPHTEPVHGAGPEVFDEDVGLLGEPAQELHAPARVEVECHAALAAVDAEEVRAVALDEWAIAPRRIASVGVLDLDDLRTEVAERHGAERAGEDAGEVEDGDPVQGSGHGVFLPSRRAGVLAAGGGSIAVAV